MSWRHVHKDTAHPPTVAALLAAGAMVLEVNVGRWGAPAHAGGGMQSGGAPDLLALYRGRWVALEVKTPKATKNKAKKAREAKQAEFRGAAQGLGADAYEVRGPLEALAALGCTPVEARRGLAAAERAERNGGMGHALPAQAGTLHLSEVEAMLSEARQRLGLDPLDADGEVDVGAIVRQVSEVAKRVRAPRGPQPAYTPPRTHSGPCSKPGCSGRAMPSASLCPGCFLEGVGA